MLGKLELPNSFAPARAPEGAALGADHPAGAAARRPFGLPGRFLLQCLAAIAAVGMLACGLLTHCALVAGVAHDARLSAHYVEQSVLQRHAEGYFGAPHEPTAERMEVDRFLSDLLWLPDVMRAQVHSPKGEVLWSSHVSSERQIFVGNPELKRALRGELVVEGGPLAWLAADKPEHQFASLPKGAFIEYYLPVWSTDRTRVVGVVEIYKSPAKIFESMRASVRGIWWGGAACGTLLFLAIAGLSHRREGILARRQQQLRGRTEDIRSAATLLAIDARAGRPATDLCRYADDILADADGLASGVDALFDAPAAPAGGGLGVIPQSRR